VRKHDRLVSLQKGISLNKTGGEMSNKDMQVVVFPKDPNPYQDLLYGHFPKETVITYFTPIKRNIFELFMVLPFTVIRLARLRLKGNKIIHIHWIYPFYLPKKLPFNKLLSYLNVAIFTMLFPKAR
jgi:hypothetical protein